MSRARGALCRACLALAAALAALLLLPLPRAPAPDPAPDPGPRAPPARPAAPRLRPDDVFIAVKTTRKNHGPRLDLLLRTWISRARRQVGGGPRPQRPCPHPRGPAPRSPALPPDTPDVCAQDRHPHPLAPGSTPASCKQPLPEILPQVPLCPQRGGRARALNLWGPRTPSTHRLPPLLGPRLR